MLYLLSVTFFFVIGGVAATLVRIDLTTPDADLLQTETYNKLFTMHGIDDDLFLSRAVDPQRAGQFFRAADDRRPRRRLSAS